jgi:hypothetical protein
VREQPIVRTEDPDPQPAGSPPAIWAAFVRQSAWKSWTIVALLALAGLLSIANIRLASRPPEVVVLDAGGQATPVKRTVATDALLSFLAERTRPPEVEIVRFTRDFLHLALAINSTTVEANWPQALSMMSPELRARMAAEAAAKKLVETYRAASRRTELAFEEVVLLDRMPGLLTVRATMLRRVEPLAEGMGQATADRIQVELVEKVVSRTLERPDGLEVAEWRLVSLPANGPRVDPGAGTQEGSRASK